MLGQETRDSHRGFVDVDCAKAFGFGKDPFEVVAAVEDEVGVLRLGFAAYETQQLDAGHVRHIIVRDYHVEPFASQDELPGLGGVADCHVVESAPFGRNPEGLTQLGVIFSIEDTHGGLRVGSLLKII